MTYNSLIKDAIQILNEHNIEDSDYDATNILLSLLDIDMARFICDKDNELSDMYDSRTIQNIINNFDNLISYRASHYPLQYILGESYFCGLKFNVNENVLIPRSDTEILVEKVLMDNPNKNKAVLDLCTGSGCIVISLAILGGYKIIVGSDISYDAIEVAKENAEELIYDEYFDDEMQQEMYFIKSDLFEDFGKLQTKTGISKFDIITANPPYIKTKDINNLMEEVSHYEPRIALDGDKDGLKFYKRIAKEAKDYLNENGLIYLEIGYNQANDVKNIFEKENYEVLEVVKDLAGNDRVVVIKK